MLLQDIGGQATLVRFPNPLAFGLSQAGTLVSKQHMTWQGRGRSSALASSLALSMILQGGGLRPSDI